MKSTDNTKASQDTIAQHFEKTLELSKAAFKKSDASIDVDVPMDRTIIRRITWEEKNAQHFAFHREFYEKERSK